MSYPYYNPYVTPVVTTPIVSPYNAYNPYNPYPPVVSPLVPAPLNPFGVDTWNGAPGSQRDFYNPVTGQGERISRRGNLVVDSPNGAETVYTRDGRVINERNPSFWRSLLGYGY